MEKSSKTFPFSPKTKIPRHIVIIPDGNRRWAQEKGLPTEVGHQKGFDAVMEVARAAQDWGVNYLTIWAFSTENWKRSTLEVRYLMHLYKEMIKKLLKEFVQKGIKVIHIGRKDRLPKFLLKTLEDAIFKTKDNKNFVVTIALDYGGRDEIVRAVQKMIAEGKNPNDLTENEFSKYLDTNGQPEPDLIIRTSGEQRLSGILPWQSTYAELYFDPTHLPDFTTENLKRAILEFSSRDRRFGGNSQKPS